MWQKTFRAMGTEIDIAVPEDPDSAGSDAMDFARERIGDISQRGSFLDGIYEDIQGVINGLEATFSRFRGDSELSHVNDHPGMWLDISPAFTSVLTAAKEAYEETGGVFHPGLGAVMEGMGYVRTFEEVLGVNPAEAADDPLANAALAYGFGDELPYVLDNDASQVYLKPGYKLDLGGIAKGWIIEQAARRFHQAGIRNFVLSAGGDMVCSGRNTEEGDGSAPWSIGIENPWNRTENIIVLDIEASCVATSGIYRRQWARGDEQVHHLVNPYSGRSAKTDIVACTVVAASLVAAEVMAKTCLILGSEAGIKWLSARPQRGWVVVRQDEEVIHAWNV